MKTAPDCQDPKALFTRKLFNVSSNIFGNGAEKSSIHVFWGAQIPVLGHAEIVRAQKWSCGDHRVGRLQLDDEYISYGPGFGVSGPFPSGN